MGENNLAFAVAQIRSLENDLLTKAAYEQILAAKDEKEIFDLLSAHGYQITEDEKNAAEVLEKNRLRVWELLKSLAPSRAELGVFTVKNDFHNLKTAIKAHFGDTNADNNILYPTSVDIKTLNTAVSEKKYDLLPNYLQAAAKTAYDALVASADGQTADIIIDKFTLREIMSIAKKTTSDIVKRYCLLTVEVADIKTAFRGAAAHKGEEFYKNALCGTDTLDKGALTRAARKGADEVISFVSSVGYTEAATALKTSVFELEKWYDKQVLSIMQDAVYINFDIEPLIAYGIKTENEIKNLRIAVTCKNMGIESAAFERMCVPDV